MRKFTREGSFGKRDSRRSDDRGSDRFEKRDFGKPGDRAPNRFERRGTGRKSDREFDGGARRMDRFGRGGSDIEMHTVICDKCGKECQVPFKPTEGKPVYCSDCFKKNGDPRSSKNTGDFETAKQLSQINAKLDKIMKALELD